MSIETSNKIANIYANALLAASPSAKSAEKSFAQLQLLLEVFQANYKLLNSLRAPTTSSSVKAEIAAKIAHTLKLDKEIHNFLLLLIKHKRLHILEIIAAKLEAKLHLARGEQKIVVMTAKKAEEAWLKKLERELSKLLDCKPLITNIEQPELLGGAVLAINSLRLDCSIANQLNQLRPVCNHALSKVKITL